MQSSDAKALCYYQQQLKQLQLGLKDQQGQFRAVPVSLTPWQLSKTQWQKAQQYSQLLGRLLLAVSRDTHWLQQQLCNLASNNLLTALAAQPGAFVQQQPALPLMRHDFMLDKQGQWRWVESNTIAAGMGPLNQQLTQLLQADYPALAANPAIGQQAKALYQAALTLRRQFEAGAPLIVFVVEPQEDNMYDQLLLQQALEQLGARVQRVTLQQLTQASITPQQRLQLSDLAQVDLLYYRTGYNLSDYSSPEALRLRSKLQRLNLVQCPDLPLQLAGSKWIQASLSQLLLSGSTLPLKRWGLTLAEIYQLRQLIMPLIPIAALSATQVRRCIDKGWIVKSQHEGGGSVYRGADALSQLNRSDDSLLIMAPIDAYIRTEAVRLLRNDGLTVQRATLSELGMFTVGDTHQYGGYLLRSKAATTLEGGVHRGGAALDSITISAQLDVRSAANQHSFGYDACVAS